MATVINTTPVARETSDSAAAGWAVAVIILIAAGLIALFVYPGYVRQSAPVAPDTNINVSLPTTGGTGTDGGAQTAPGSSGGSQSTPDTGGTAPAM